ncbi:hypothetical protein RJT34_05784 [Clitoria ternatea]|uniref:mitogen-activated protein kinase kinase kinase n=1 Tax=Clitoria ternatea TaxID=43366 RepID=A0AAN9PTX0_CLITE
MRWFPTLVFSNSSPSPSSSSATPTLKPSPSVSHNRKHTRSVWLFGRRSTHSRKVQHVADIDTPVVPLSRSVSSSDRSSAEPHPLPLPDYPLPSPLPKDASAVAASAPATSGFRMRRTNTEHMETRFPGMAPQDKSGSSNAGTPGQGGNFWINVPARSAPTSPFTSPTTLSPNITQTDDFVPYYYVTPRGNQFWSAPEMPTYQASSLHIPPAFFDLSAFPTDNNNNNNNTSPHQQHPKSPTTKPSSPLPTLSSLESSTPRRETAHPLSVVHPLPLPPWAGHGPGPPLPSPSSTFPHSPPVAKTEPLSMKSKWQKGKLIGRGTFGSVYVATNRGTGALCAMKEVEIFSDDPKSAECIKQLEQEIKVLSNLKHPNIVQYYGSEIVEDKFYIYLEYVYPGSINKYVREHCGAITESVVRNFTRHILSGLAYLHTKKTIHRDIKGANLLVDSAGVVKLADFGMAKHLTGHSADLSLKGSPYWMAPELMQAVIQKDNSSDLAFAVDIWSLGCTIIEMFTGKPPWSEYEGAAAMFKVMKDTPPIPETLSPEGKDFLRLCFKRNPAERPTASMLLDHRFLKNLQQPNVSPSTQLFNGTTLTVI